MMDGLLDKVFSWSIEDIFNENLYREQVKRIPESFETLPEYFSSYIYPLLEETRAELCSSLEIISQAPFAQLVSYERVKPWDSRLYDVSISDWKNRFDRGKAPYKTLPGDVFAIVKYHPETISDLQVVARSWVLASVRKIPKVESEDNVDDDSSSTFFKVETSRDIGEGEHNDGYSSLFLIFLMNIITNKRIWDALHMHVNLKLIREVLQRKLTAEDTLNPCCSMENGLSENISVDLSSRLNPSQVEAVIASVQATQCNHKSQIRLIWGPPGTGKTKTVSTFLSLLLNMKVRTLTCAPTNVAIKEVASRVLGLVRNSSLEESDELCPFLGDIILFGNKQRLTVDSNIEDIYLDYRVDRLAECFASRTGWRGCLPYLSNFLENCVSDYNVYVENELIKTREQGIDDAVATRQIISFLDFVRSRFISAAVSVRHFISVFGTHMSRSYIGDCNSSYLRRLWDLLFSFEQMLEDHTNSSELLKLFTSEEVEGSPLDTLPPIEVERRKCISALKILHQSLGCLKLPSSTSKELLAEFCFQMASLIFCTASSSSRLYKMGVEPFSLLVIDEAAQLKECESAIPLQLPGLRHAILIGDECQLPAMVKSNVSAEAGFGRSLFQRLSLLGSVKHLLNMQYRMHPSISAFPNAEFYSNQILDAPSVESTLYERQYLSGSMYGPYSFINISDGRDELDDDGRSQRNMVEAVVVAKILQNLYKIWRHKTERLAIGVVSPYAAQVVAIEDLIGSRYEKLHNFVVKVKSVDGFQGGEEDIIILSTVRANNAGNVGFISDRQRTNVALTRARHCLWVLGNEKTLSRSDSVWKGLVGNAQARNCFFNVDEDNSLTEAVINMKKELNQLDDLLNKDSIIFKSARWKVLFSDAFIKSFSKLPSSQTKRSVMNLLVKLSCGWRPKKIKVDPVCGSAVQIVKQYKVEGRYIICTKDIAKALSYSQVLKIWDIVPLEDVSALVRRLDNIYGALTDDFLNRCKEKSLLGDLEVPRTWSKSLDIVRHKNNNAESTIASDNLDVVNYAENSKVNESLILMKFYSLSAGTVGHLLSDSDGQTLDLPFEVTDQEMEIISHEQTSFILGRSGTGKTTVLTMKLFQKEQLHHMALEGLSDDQTVHNSRLDENLEYGAVLRQLFVTVSPKLCYAIKQHVSHLKSFARGESSSSEDVSLSIDDLDNGEQFRDIPDSFVDLPPKLYPLVITFNKFLLMLDGTLGASYFHRFHDDEVGSSLSGCSSLRSAAFLMKKKEVTYDKFCLLYWPHFNSKLTKNLDSSRVFTEMISFIKGGLHVGETVDGRLALESYLNLSKGRTSTLSHEKRDAIYHIFLHYEKMKLERREFDLADFVNDLHRRLKHERYDGDFIDYVYIDEVQDLSIRQIALFKYICGNVDEGFVFSGDTAQTIARGIDFRFEDVRCLFYKEFLVRKTRDEANGIHEKGSISPIFQLSENFRTHGGILNLGQSVIELIYHFFPQSIDKLSPETSHIFGEAPILLESGSDEDAIVTIFGNNGNVGCNLIGFGAEQVILVRDECVRQEISSYVGKNALVLTIVECKGLEFQDVLLYNFFGSSPLRNQWRVIYEYMNVKDLLDSALPVSFPEFSSGKHNVLCSELKQLYVAITRTRQRLWICENKDDLSKPMFDYWKKLCVVQVRKLDDSLARAMQVASTPDEWKARGRKLLVAENYEVATMCFERAGDKHLETLAKALGLKASATRLNELNPKEASNILRQAANLFESISLFGKAADCYFELKDFHKAGNLYFKHCDNSFLERAGECFTLAGCYELAATVYAKCNRFSECLSSCTNGKLFDMGMQYIQSWKQHNTATDLDMIEQVFLENCALSQLQQDDKKGMMKFVKAFCSEDSMRAFLQKCGCFDELIVLEEEFGNFLKAADIARDIGEFLLEAEFLHKGGLFKEACEYVLWHVFASCLWANGSKGWPLNHFQQMEELLLKAKASAHSSGEQLLYQNVCSDVLILLNRKYSLPQLQEFLVFFQNRKNLRGEIIYTRRILDLILHTHSSKYELEFDRKIDPGMHSMQMISQGKVSVVTMIYFWKSWEETMLKILKCFNSFEANNSDNFHEVQEFFLNFLGVRKLPSKMGPVYVCLHRDAEWLKQVHEGFFTKFGKLVSIDVLQLLAAARNYCSTELISTGMEVLKVLDELTKRGKEGIFSELSKARIFQLGFEVAQLLSNLKCAKLNYQESQLLQRYYSEESMVAYFLSIFPLDWRRVSNKDFIYLREMKVSSNILEKVILMYLVREEELTFWKLGRIAMGLLGMPNCKTDLYMTVVKRCDDSYPWKSFFEALSTCKRAETLNGTPIDHLAETPEISLSYKLLDSLRDAYDADWRAKDYISPNCFLYLADRLMVSLLEFQGRMFITRSSLVEWFTHIGWKGSLITNLSADSGKSRLLNDAYGFLAHMVHEFLMNTHEIVKWVRRENLPVFQLRLVTMLSLIHLNNVNNMNYKAKLQDVLKRSEVAAQLPSIFREALKKRTTTGMMEASSIALNSIGDPLVIVSIGVAPPRLSCKSAIFLNIDNQNKEDLLRILFPSNVNASPGRVSDDYSLGSINLQVRADIHEMLVKDSGPKMTVDWNVWELFETLKLVGENNDKSWQRFVSSAANLKVQVDKLHDLMRTVTAVATVKESFDDNYSTSMLAESQSLLLELRLLSAILATSGNQLKESMLLIKDSAEKLISRKQAFEYFLGPLILQAEPEKPQTDDVVESQIDSKADEEATFEGTSKGVAKNKGKQNRKGKSRNKKKNRK